MSNLNIDSIILDPSHRDNCDCKKCIRRHNKRRLKLEAERQKQIKDERRAFEKETFFGKAK